MDTVFGWFCTYNEFEEEPGVLHGEFPRRAARHDPLQRHLLVHQLQCKQYHVCDVNKTTCMM